MKLASIVGKPSCGCNFQIFFFSFCVNSDCFVNLIFVKKQITTCEAQSFDVECASVPSNNRVLVNFRQ